MSTPSYQSQIFQQIGEVSQDIYFIFDVRQNTFIYLNPAFQTAWQLSFNEAMQQPGVLYQSIHPEDRNYVTDCYRKAIQTRGENQIEFRVLSKDQQEKFVSLNLYPLENDGTPLLAGIVRDITVLQSNIYYAEKINARKNSMLEILAHDLKGPIGMVRMMASSIEKDLKAAGNDQALQTVKTIQDLCKRNIALIRDLTNHEFLESQEVGLRKERIDIVAALGDVIDNYKRSADILAKKFAFTYSAEKIYLQMDSLKLMQVFNNLISNALKFTPDNGVIELDIQDKHPNVQISVRDNGIGIPADLQPYLFDKFTRARRQGLRGEEPIGLGMSIIKYLVELHGGKIWFESKENAGSTFYIELPKA